MRFLDNPLGALRAVSAAAAVGPPAGPGAVDAMLPRRRAPGEPGPFGLPWPHPGPPSAGPDPAGDCPPPTEAEVSAARTACEAKESTAKAQAIAKCQREYPGYECSATCTKLEVGVEPELGPDGECKLKTICDISCDFTAIPPSTFWGV